MTAGRRVILFAWLNARPKHMQKYQQLYEELGVRGDRIHTVYARPTDVLQPASALARMQRLHDELQATDGEAVLHTFSVGAYMTAQLLHAVERAGGEARSLRLVVDSPVDYEGVPAGLARSATDVPALQKAIQLAVQMYRASFTGVTAEHKKASERFHRAPQLLPDSRSLWFYSRDDLIADHRRCDACFDAWQAFDGHTAERHVFDESDHCGHLRRHPHIYRTALQRFID